MDYVTFIGLTAGALTTIAFLPQVIKVRRRKQTRDLSLPMYIVLSLGIGLWIIYGVFLNSPPIIIANSITVIFSIYILIMKIKHG
ncbi:MAG: SemiSWEET transporter [Candidatus Omnitrophota bacterium]|nr:SemiSWEET transporter [Candidatus Omnitrophota bacterium]